MPETQYKVLITSSDFPQVGLDILKDKVQVVKTTTRDSYNRECLEESSEEILRLIEGVDGIIWCGWVRLTKHFLDKAGSKLKVVSTYSTGVDHIDVDELKQRGIILTNTSSVLDGAVAEMAVLLMLGAARRAIQGIQQIHSGKWIMGPQSSLGFEIYQSTVGVIGFGGIGQTIVKKLQGFGAKEFLYTSRTEKPEANLLGVKYVSLDALLKESDFVVVACNLNESTKHLLNASAFRKMKNTAIVVNIARGDVIEQDALIDALRNKTIFAAGLDVMSPEPLPADNPLVALSNCFLLPHIGSGTYRTRDEMARLAALDTLLGIAGDPVQTPVCT